MCAEEEKVDLKECSYAKYVSDILERYPMHIGKFLSCFVYNWVGSETKGTSLDISKVEKYIDINTLYEKIIKKNKDVYTTKEGKNFVELFLQEYKESKNSQ